MSQKTVDLRRLILSASTSEIKKTPLDKFLAESKMDGCKIGVSLVDLSWNAPVAKKKLLSVGTVSYQCSNDEIYFGMVVHRSIEV